MTVRARFPALRPAALAALLCAGAGLAAAGPVHLALRADVSVPGATLALGQLAEVGSDDATLAAALKTLPVGAAPRAGYVEQYSRAELERLIHARALAPALQLSWSGARAVSVHATAQLLDSEELVRHASAFLRTQLEGRFSAIELQVTTAPKAVELPLGAVSMTARLVDPANFHARRQVWVDIAVDAKPYRSVLVPFTLKVTRPAYVARRDLAPGALTGADDFDIATRDVSEVADSALAVPELQGQARAARQIRRGEVVLRSQLAQAGTVYRGDNVRLVLAEGGLAIETRAVAQQDGAIGQLVRVKPDTSVDAITGRVIAAGVVQAEGR